LLQPLLQGLLNLVRKTLSARFDAMPSGGKRMKSLDYGGQLLSK
jgi:hypothetical protein